MHQRHRYSYGSRGLLAFLLSLLAIFACWRPAGAQSQGRSVTLTLLPDLDHKTVTVQAIVYPGNLTKEAAGLGDWGLRGNFTVWKADESSTALPWYLQGKLYGAQIISGENGFYKLHLGAIKLPPGDSLNLALPFTNLDYARISPTPENLAELISPEPIDSLNMNPLRLISYSAGVNGKVLDHLDIPFKPLRKEIDLALVPLVGEEATGQETGFRLAGQVTFDGITDWVEFSRHCDNAPESNYYRYRVADLLFALDYPPAYHFGYLLPAFAYKPTYTNLSSEIISCEYKSGSGQVIARFSGRASSQTVSPGLFPEFLRNQDITESNRTVRVLNRATGRYEIHMGEIVLGSGDVLRLQMPGSDILSVDPAPVEFSFNGPGQSRIVYEGPQRFDLTIDYTYRADLLLRQLPATVRAIGSPLENNPGLPSALPFGWQTWALMLVGLALIGIGWRAGLRYRVWIEFVGWITIGAAFYFGLRNVFGWMLLAVILYLRSAWPERRSVGRGLLVGVLVILSLLADQAGESLFLVLGRIGEDLTPFTPAILSLLALLAFFAVFYRDGKPENWTPGKMLPFALFLFSLSVYDAMQNSLPALVLAAIWAGLLVFRARQGKFGGLDISHRFALVFRERIFLLGLVVLIAFETTYGLAATPAIIATFSPGFGIFRQFLPPVLLVLSIVLSFLTTGALFLMLYPLLPFEAGPLKAVFFALALLSLFTFGIGSDNRLVTGLEQILVGRFVYYLSIPLLIGLIIDVKQMIAGEPGPEMKGTAEKEQESPMSRLRNGLKQYLEQQERILSTLGALLSLAAPALYAAIFNQPLVTTYFQILRVLITI